MSNLPNHICPHCGRSNFKSQRGLTQHINSSKDCASKQSAKHYGIGKINTKQVDPDLEDTLVEDFLAWQGISPSKNDTDEVEKKLAENQEVRHNYAGIMQPMDDDLMGLLDDISDNLEYNPPDGNTEILFVPCRDYLEQFKEYCGKAKKAGKFTKDKVSAIKLMYTLWKKGYFGHLS